MHLPPPRSRFRIGGQFTYEAVVEMQPLHAVGREQKEISSARVHIVTGWNGAIPAMRDTALECCSFIIGSGNNLNQELIACHIDLSSRPRCRNSDREIS